MSKGERMRFLKEKIGRWAVPGTLAAVLAAALLITPVIAGTITGKKVNKTINKKTNATQLVVPGVLNVPTASTTLATLNLKGGSYLVSTTFDARRGNVAENVACQLRIGGVAQDQSSSFTASAPSAEDTVAMQVVGRVGAPTTATVSCSSSLGTGQVNHLEITALKVPKVRVIG
jgi:hypothetical protein